MFYMFNRCGAWQVGNDHEQGKVSFKIFFPQEKVPDEIESIKVVGTFQEKIGQSNWDCVSGIVMTKAPLAGGELWSGESDVELPQGFYEYKYYVTFKNGRGSRYVSDPCARYGGSSNNNSGFVIGGSRAVENRIAPLKSGRKPLRELVIYELMIDDFTKEYLEGRAPLEAVMDRLDYLQNDLGVNAVLFMPWTAWAGNGFNWGYDPYMYFAIEYRYANSPGRPAEKISLLKKLIDRCHKRDIHVIMDGVFNHVNSGFPYKGFYLNEDDCPYTGNFGGTFTGLQDLDFHNRCTQDFIRDVCLYWIDIFKIDGIRFDNTVNFHIPGNPAGLETLISDIRGYLAGLRESNFSLTLEHIRDDAVEVTKGIGADSYWDNGLHNKAFHYLWHDHIDSGLLNAMNNNFFLNDSGDRVATIYLTNHDHSQLGWRLGARDNSGAMHWWRAQPYVITLLTSPGAVLIPNGDEFAESYWLMENDEGTGRRVQSRPLHWSFKEDKIGSSLLKLYRRLIELRKEFKALTSNNFYPQRWEEWQTVFNPQGYGIDLERQLVVFHRWADREGYTEKFIIAINFSQQDHELELPFSENGVWRDMLHDYNGNYQIDVNGFSHRVTINSHWGRVFYKGC